MDIRKVFLILCITAIAYFFFADKQKKEKNSLDDLEKMDLVLTGKVVTVYELPSSNGFGVVRVDVIKSNITYYDPRSDYENYYCLIKNNMAELYQQGVQNCYKGDTIEVNARKRTFAIKMNGDKVEKELILYNNPDFFRRVERDCQDF
ncbi:MAG TPA: hypothetical protein VGO58_06290 [Chitinophagaceae bacterium]|jgi:hypothetical protein|nr:hypothetical protein [Chitinophagaceae bacterium]